MSAPGRKAFTYKLTLWSPTAHDEHVATLVGLKAVAEFLGCTVQALVTAFAKTNYGEPIYRTVRGWNGVVVAVERMENKPPIPVGPDPIHMAGIEWTRVR